MKEPQRNVDTQAWRVQRPTGVHQSHDDKCRVTNDLADSIHLAATLKYLKTKNERLLDEVEELQSANDKLEDANEDLKRGISERQLEITSLCEVLLNIRGLGYNYPDVRGGLKETISRS